MEQLAEGRSATYDPDTQTYTLRIHRNGLPIVLTGSFDAVLYQYGQVQGPLIEAGQKIGSAIERGLTASEQDIC